MLLCSCGSFCCVFWAVQIVVHHVSTQTEFSGDLRLRQLRPLSFQHMDPLTQLVSFAPSATTLCQATDAGQHRPRVHIFTSSKSYGLLSCGTFDPMRAAEFFNDFHRFSRSHSLFLAISWCLFQDDSSDDYTILAKPEFIKRPAHV